MTSLTLSDNGRVLIPAALREQLGFKPGGKLYAEVKDGSLVDEFIAERRAEAAREERE